MNRIFYIMGKSSSGKDSIYKKLIAELGFDPLVIYTTRPMRENETEGREYHFVDKDEFLRMKKNNAVIEERHYDTVHGEWIYFTAKDSIDLSQNILGIGTLESYVKLRDYFGGEVVRPIYIEVDDGIRLLRAVERERIEVQPKYAELCRRFLADTADFSEENLAAAGITKRFSNDGKIEDCIADIIEYISKTAQ